MSIKNKVLKGIMYTGAYSTFVMVISLAYQIMKAQYLESLDFAIIAAMFMLISFSDTFIKYGLSQVIVKNKNITFDHIKSFMIINYIYVFIFMCIIWMLMPLIIRVYHLPNIDMLLYMFIIIILNVPISLYKSILEKNLQYGLFTVINTNILLTNVLIGGLLLTQGYGIYSLFYSYMISTVLDLIVTIYVTLKYSNMDSENIFPNIKLLYSDNKNDINYGSKISTRRFVNVFGNKIDEFIVGLLFTGHELGLYYFGKDLFLKLIGLLNSSVAKVILPVFSITKDDIAKTKLVYITFIKGIVYIGLPAILMMVFYPEEVILALFGEKWIESATIFMALSIGMFFSLITSNMTTSLLTIYDKAKESLIIELRTTIIYLTILSTIVLVNIEVSIVFISILLSIKIVSIAMQNHNICLKILKLNFNHFISLIKMSLIYLVLLLMFYSITIYFEFIYNLLDIIIFMSFVYLLTFIFIILFDKSIMNTLIKRRK
jgi:teichuronic acid exporter